MQAYLDGTARIENQIIHDRYVVRAEIGQGADAVVYRADDPSLGRTVALKLLRPALCADDTFVARFEREARSAGGLSHPHVVAVYDFGEALDTHFLVMEYVPGGDLRERLQSGERLPMETAVRLAAEVAEALGAAHAKGVVHRDVKPANILLTEDGHAKLSDFGIAKLLAAPGITAAATVLGTPHYLAPEVVSGGVVTPATDVYALGVVLFEMLVGRRPFEGETAVQVIMQHLLSRPSLTELQQLMPAELATLVVRALAKEPAVRFADGAALAEALRAQERALTQAVWKAARTEEEAATLGASARTRAETGRPMAGAERSSRRVAARPAGWVTPGTRSGRPAMRTARVGAAPFPVDRVVAAAREQVAAGARAASAAVATSLAAGAAAWQSAIQAGHALSERNRAAPAAHKPWPYLCAPGACARGEMPTRASACWPWDWR
jgi:eukaryotic-like serine/threonine-protein kinase